MKAKQPLTTRLVVRCAIYTRKSTEEGLEQEFNSLDAQRESAEAFIKSQAHEGWTCLPERYDDGGFTGGNMDRPALKRLMAEMEAGKIDCVVVYKVDRLSRSLLDFSRMMETFDRRQISFVSVTQQFNTATSMGRLILNVLFSFAQFEREMISERTRDKMGAARRKGKYVGGVAMLGYDIDHERKKLVVNEEEADRVRQIFELYLEHGAMLPVVQELASRGWTNKQRLTRKGATHGGKPFTKTSLHKFLTHVIYVGQVSYRDETFNGEQLALVSPEIWERVQTLLQRNRQTDQIRGRSKYPALLKGLLYCQNCACSMTPVATGRKGTTKQYRYYVCSGAQRNGWSSCPTKSIPAAEIERFVLDQIRELGNGPLGAGWGRVGLPHEGDANYQGFYPLATVGHSGGGAGSFYPLSVASPLWETLPPREQRRIIESLVARVEYDGAAGKIAVTLHTAEPGSSIEAFNEEKMA